MDRIVKFRGLLVDNVEKWVYGDFTRCSDEVSYITEDLVENIVHQVFTKSVGQYTGLKDENDEEIYENDVVYIKTKYFSGFAKVKYRDGLFVCMAMGKRIEHTLISVHNKCEVV